MAQFRATIQGNRGEASRLGTKSSGIEARINGWDSGVRVDAAHSIGTDNRDHFHIYATGGSNHAKADGYIGEVVDGKFIPSDALRERMRDEFAAQREAMAAETAALLERQA